LIVDYHLTGCVSGISLLADTGGRADDCGYRKPFANRRQE